MAKETNNKAKRNHKGELKPQIRLWHDIIGTKVSTFLSILLISRLYKLFKITDYWNTNPNKLLFILIQRLFSLNRW